MAKKQIKLSSALTIEVMMNPHINIKNASTFSSDNSKTKLDIKSHFSGLTRNKNIYLLRKRKLAKYTNLHFTLFHKTFQGQQNLKSF